jgi:hypothetical protein
MDLGHMLHDHYSCTSNIHGVVRVTCQNCLLKILFCFYQQQFCFTLGHVCYYGNVNSRHCKGNIDILSEKISEYNFSCLTDLYIVTTIFVLFFIARTDVDAVVDEISRKEPLITPTKSDQVRKLVVRLQEKLQQTDDHTFYLFKVYLLVYNI